jgi:hypothetical protein
MFGGCGVCLCAVFGMFCAFVFVCVRVLECVRVCVCGCGCGGGGVCAFLGMEKPPRVWLFVWLYARGRWGCPLVSG